MSIAALTVVLAFASFALLSTAAGLLARCSPVEPDHAAARNARALFARAVAPTLLSATIVVVLLVPSFLMHEVPRKDEWPGALLLLLAFAGVVRAAQVVVRGFRTFRAARALVRVWSSQSSPLPLEPWGIRASRIDVGFPVVAVAGLFNPRVFVDQRVIEACSAAELAAVAAHERAHVTSHDNLRRLLIAACVGHRSETAAAWRVAAERAADERAVHSPQAAADLAGALLRVARYGPVPTLPLAAISTIHDGGSLESRIRCLLAVAPVERKLKRAWPAMLTASMVTLSLMIATPLPKVLHAALELLVQRLP